MSVMGGCRSAVRTRDICKKAKLQKREQVGDTKELLGV